MLPLLIGAGILVAVLALKGSSGGGGNTRCGDTMSVSAAEIFDKGMSLPHPDGDDIPKAKIIVATFDAQGYHKAANCLRVHFGL